MSDAPIIVARNLRKEYQIHKRQATTLKEVVVKNLFAPSEVSTHVALEDVSFSIPRGHSLAIIGGNGSGKSTLLKLIAGITDPTSGSITATGRIAALLELGAGFEPEFTGMENIFLQCSILGLDRREIFARLEKILEFSQLDQFIHTPVKRYSSGMYIRLGFAIAAHVDADVLLLDEVLAVGDAAFQVKCQRKIAELREEGRTILFVSHALEHVERIADLVLWLDHGEVLEYGTADEVLPRYYEAIHGVEEESTSSSAVNIDIRTAAALPTGRSASRKAAMTEIDILDASGQSRRNFIFSEPLRLKVRVEVREPVERIELSMALGTMDGLRAAWIGTGRLLRDLQPGVYTIEADIQDHLLTPGRYLVSLMLGDPSDASVVYDMHLRLYAISLQNENRRIEHDADEARIQPLGAFADTPQLDISS